MTTKFDVSEITENFGGDFKEKRDCFSQIMDYLQSEHQSSICAVYGLWRTGKTTLLKQAAAALPDKEKALYIRCREGETDFYDILNFIEDRIKAGYRYFFIDEITCAENFQHAFTVLSDIDVDIKNTRIVVTGTDSLGLNLASRDAMYGRITEVRTTYTSFAEFARLTGISTIDGYIANGCTLKQGMFDTKAHADEFIETAIVHNIINSLKNYEDVRRYPSVLTQKYSEEQIACEIRSIINRYSHVSIVRAVASQFRSAMSGAAGELTIQQESILKLKYNEVNRRVAEILGCDKSSSLKPNDISQLYDYIERIGVFEKIPVYTSYNEEIQGEPIEMVCHPAMLHANIKYVLQELQRDGSWIDAFPEEKDDVLAKAYQSAMDKIMENIIISDVYHAPGAKT
jgi:predicted AAA+ superfamily ATPase